MAKCYDQREFFANYSMEAKIDYHRHPLLFALEVFSLIVIMVLGNIANVSVAVAILRVPSLRRNLNNILVINLVVMDLCASAGSMPFSLYDLFNEGYLLCLPLLCQIHGIFAILACFGNFSAVVLISIFRCIGIVAGHKITMKMHHVFMMIAGGWFCALAMVIPPITGSASTSVYTHGTHHCSPSWKDSCLYYTIGVVLVYCITIPTLVISYGLITWTIKRSADRMADYDKRGQHGVHFKDLSATDTTQNDLQTTNNQVEASSQQDTFQEDSFVLNPPSNVQSSDQTSTISERLDVHPQLKQLPPTKKGNRIVKKKSARSKLPHYRRYDKKVAVSGAVLVLTTTVCWTPYFIVHACSVEKTPSHGLEVFTMWLAYLNAALDPIIYTMLNKKIQKAVMEPLHYLRGSVMSKCFN